MYNLPYHKAQNEQVIKAFVGQYPFAFLSGCNSDEDGRVIGTHEKKNRFDVMLGTDKDRFAEKATCSVLRLSIH